MFTNHRRRIKIAKKNKKVPGQRIPPATKTIQNLNAPSENTQKHLRFRFNHIDLEESWSLSSIQNGDLHDLLSKLKNFETMTLGEIFHGASGNNQAGKQYAISSIIPKAQSRLSQLQLDDSDVVHRLQIDGKKRLYGILRDNLFSILWWDPWHEICPSPLKRT